MEATNGAENKTFTQDEVNTMIGERLARQAEKYSDYEDLKTKAAEYDKQQEANKTELQKAQEKAAKLQSKIDSMESAGKIRDIRDKVSRDTGVPVDLINGEDEDTCKAQAEAILKFAKGSHYPGVKTEKTSRASSDDAADQDFKKLAAQIFGRKE